MNDSELLLEEEKEDKRFYKLSLWWVTHRALLRRIALGLFIVFDVLLLLWVALHLLDAFAISYDAEERAVAQMVALGQSDLHAYTEARAAEDLFTGEARVFSTGSSMYDFFAVVENPNEDWWATFTYRFESGDAQTGVMEGFVLPGDVAYLTELGIESDSPIQRADVVIEDLQWKRLDHHWIEDYQTWSDERLNLVIDDVVFEAVDQFDESFARSSFTVTNDTAFGYYDVALLVLLKRGSSVVGVNKTILRDLESREMAPVALNWFGVIPSVSEVEVVPVIQLFDLDSYKPAVGENTLDTRLRVFER